MADNQDVGAAGNAESGRVVDGKGAGSYALVTEPSREYLVRCSTPHQADALRSALRFLYDDIDVRGFKHAATSIVISYRGTTGPIPATLRQALREDVLLIDERAIVSVPAKRRALDDIANRPA
jgi:hypothetical protein